MTAALIELLLERGWDAIGVGELCARADISRSTFYLHYSNKEELLESGFAALHAAIRASAKVRIPHSNGGLSFANSLAEHIFDNRRTFLAIVGSNGSNIVRERFRTLLLKLIVEDLQAGGARMSCWHIFYRVGFCRWPHTCWPSRRPVPPTLPRHFTCSRVA